MMLRSPRVRLARRSRSFSLLKRRTPVSCHTVTQGLKVLLILELPSRCHCSYSYGRASRHRSQGGTPRLISFMTPLRHRPCCQQWHTFFVCRLHCLEGALTWLILGALGNLHSNGLCVGTYLDSSYYWLRLPGFANNIFPLLHSNLPITIGRRSQKVDARSVGDIM
jgi:hypothetical protein